MSELEELIERQRVALESPRFHEITVVVAGVRKTVRVSKLRPDDWQQLVRSCPPSPGYKPDESIGYNQDALPRAYPVERLLVDGEAVSQDLWAALFSVVDSSHKNNLHTAMWDLNVMSSLTELKELGKAEAGQSSSLPANRESRRAASKAASRQK